MAIGKDFVMKIRVTPSIGLQYCDQVGNNLYLGKRQRCYLSIDSSTLRHEPHFHVDKAYSYSQSSALSEQIDPLEQARSTWHQYREVESAADLSRNVWRALSKLRGAGVTNLRAHIDTSHQFYILETIMSIFGSCGLDVSWAWMPSMPLTTGRGNIDRLYECMCRWGGSVGGAPQFDRNPIAACKLLIDLAAEFETSLDLHIDEFYRHRTDSVLMWLLKEYPNGTPTPLIIAHANSIAWLSTDELMGVSSWLRSIETPIVCLPQTHLHFSLDPKYYHNLAILAKGGVTVLLGVDNVADPFNPEGRLDRDEIRYAFRAMLGRYHCGNLGLYMINNWRQGTDAVLTEVAEWCKVDNGRGYNFKNVYSSPRLFRDVIEILRYEIPPNAALVAADEGIAALVGAVALVCGAPFWVVRNREYHARVSMGTLVARDHAWISGGNVLNDMHYVIIDDIMGSGAKLSRAVTLARRAACRRFRLLLFWLMETKRMRQLSRSVKMDVAFALFT